MYFVLKSNIILKGMYRTVVPDTWSATEME